MRFLGSPWPMVTAALRKAKTRTAVTAYLTSAATNTLPLEGKRDRLIVDASNATVSAGLTDPRVIEIFAKRKVRCYSVQGLHAKVYLADGVMFCGSANATSNSLSLEEACLQVTKATIVAEFEEWLGGLRLEPIDDERIAKLKTLFKRAKWKPGATKGKSVARAWITWIDEYIDSEEIDEYVESLAEQKSLDAEDIDYITMSAARKPSRLFKEAERGDELFVIQHHDGRRRLYAPSRVIAPAKVLGDKRIIAMELTEETVTLKRLLSKAKSAGMKLPKSGKTERSLSAKNATVLRRMFFN